MPYHVVTKCGGGAFFVPTEAAENLRLCSALQLRILLLTLSRGQCEMTPELAASELCANEEDARDALDYWCARGILQADGSGAQTALTPSVTDAQTGEKADAHAEKEPTERIPISEVATLVCKNDGIAFVLSEAERLLGKALSTYDSETLAWLISGAGAEPELIVTVMEYCRSIGKCNLRYIKSTLLGWLDEGIDSAEKAEERIRILNEKNSWEGEVKRVLEIRDRGLIAKEKEFCESWKNLNISPELIRCAYERAIEQKGKYTFNYINGILISWKQKGITTPKEAANEASRKSEESKASFDTAEVDKQITDQLFY